ncbi:MAG TPA: septum formation initiator family protein [Candidatus Paceibacterota bacterium]|nr:septum formation initiator family protein [Candidatus Paceibacterota bacterium]
MFDFHEKRKLRRILFGKPFIFFLFFVSILLTVSVYHRFVASRDMRERLDVRKAELVELEMRAEALQAKVNHLSDERGVEEELRSRFDVAKEGEQVVILIDERDNRTQATNSPTTTHATTVTKQSGFWSWLGFN